ncbi:acyl-CoA thioesterase [Dokdonia sinensis]|uniref:Acyl-CoA thioesterase n=1 Tax=Dokdonia sinensis TaxID=2479847 RepID=A0A3M0FU18_9FLAO|nr:thioesterase family protein [Dokdonia sinensis]RMB56151.1 acyl-CoA thioesterase [Dokdonia sinensis]
MKKHLTFVKVRYAETDQMGVVHHGNYAQYLELARIDWLDNLGISYKWMEDNGVMLPVYKLELTFKKSATFDDELKIETSLRELPSVRIIFDYKIYNQSDDLLTVASAELIFISKDSKRPIRCPDYILDLLKK